MAQQQAKTTFFIRKFKLSSNYIHQKSMQWLSWVYSKYGPERGLKMMYFCIFQTQQMVYCRGKRELNLLANMDGFLSLLSHGLITDILDIKYDGIPILSKRAKKLSSPAINNKHIHYEMAIISLLFYCFLHPLIKLMANQSVNNTKYEVLKVLEDAEQSVDDGKGNKLYVAFGSFFRSTNFSNLLHSENNTN